MDRVACLSGDDIADLLDGKKIVAHGIDFVFDGLGVQKIEKSLASIKKKTKQEKDVDKTK